MRDWLPKPAKEQWRAAESNRHLLQTLRLARSAIHTRLNEATDKLPHLSNRVDNFNAETQRPQFFVVVPLERSGLLACRFCFHEGHPTVWEQTQAVRDASLVVGLQLDAHPASLLHQLDECTLYKFLRLFFHR